MKRISLRGLVPPAAVVFAVVFAACETSPVPLSDPPALAVDPAFTGLWEIAETGGEPVDPGLRERMLVLPFNDHEYYVEYYSTETRNDVSVPGDTARYRVFLSEVASRLVANIQCIECEDERGFLFMLAESVDGRLRLTPFESGLYDGFRDFTRAEQARDRMAMALIQDTPFEDPAVFRKLDWQAKSWAK